MMRTTLALADDVLAAAQAIADAQNRTVGDVISDLARRSLQRPATASTIRNAIPILSGHTLNAPVSLDVVNELRDELP